MKSKPLRKTGFFLLFITILFSFLAIRLTSPPDVVRETAPDSVFSAIRASRYLYEIAKAPHSTGTPENKRVREYIVGICSQLGLETRVQNTTAETAFGDRLKAANVYNVIARLKGQNSGKYVLVMAHYDSQPNSPAAGDDGSSVAAMLETARILTSTKKAFKNDIVFLFTDAEESGVLGAQGFLQDSLSRDIGLVLNFDNRGNSGISVMFEANEKNGWVVKHFIRSAAYPYANSLSYEIYKTLPNYKQQ